MGFKFFAAFRKEWLILIRDVAGLLLLFIMPLIMVVILTLVQEYGWSTITKEPRIPVLYVDLDQDTLSRQLEEELTSENFFSVIRELDGSPISAEQARNLVKEGTYQIALIMPEKATEKTRKKISSMVGKTMMSLTMPNLSQDEAVQFADSINIVIYFDPEVRPSFRKAFTRSMEAYNARIEAKMIFEAFQREIRKMIPGFTMPAGGYEQTTQFKVNFPAGDEEDIYPSSTQHNVPAWSLFAMFFIVIPLTGSIIKEREEGSLLRLLTIPVSYVTIFMAKIGVYLIVCFFQFAIIVLAGIYLMPLFNMSPLEVGDHYLSIAVMTIVSALAALGYGVMVGTLAKTHQQAAAFGSVSVVILTALGGLWVPTYLMPESMRIVASYSPLNWAYEGFLDLFLRNGNFISIVPELIKLLAFFAITISIAAIYRRIHPPIGQ